MVESTCSVHGNSLWYRGRRFFYGPSILVAIELLKCARLYNKAILEMYPEGDSRISDCITSLEAWIDCPCLENKTKVLEAGEKSKFFGWTARASWARAGRKINLMTSIVHWWGVFTMGVGLLVGDFPKTTKLEYSG